MTLRRLARPGLRRLATATLAAASALSITAGLTAALPGTATAATTSTTPYLLAASAFGTKVTAPNAGLSSGPSALALTGCSNRVPRTTSNDVTGVGTGTTGLTIDAVTSSTRAWRGTIGGRRSTAVRGVSNVAEVAVGNASTLQLQLKDVHGVSTTWADKRGYHASTSLTLTSALTGPGAAALGPVAELFTGSSDKLLSTLAKHPVVVPGLAQISLGGASRTVTKHGASARRTGLVVDVFQSPSQLAPASGDTVVTVGNSHARMARYVTGGVFGGRSWGLEAPVLDGKAHLGRNVLKVLSCFGTGGHIRKAALARLDLGSAGEVVASTMESDVYGAHTSTGSHDWTSSTLGEVDLAGGQLVLKAVTVKALANRGKDGRLHRSVRRSIGSITANGTTYPAPAPGQSIEIPGLATIVVPRAVYGTSGVRATGLRVTLFPGTPAKSVLDLANASAVLRH